MKKSKPVCLLLILRKFWEGMLMWLMKWEVVLYLLFFNLILLVMKVYKKGTSCSSVWFILLREIIIDFTVQLVGSSKEEDILEVSGVASLISSRFPLPFR